MSFCENTGRTEIRRCGVCGVEVEHEEIRFLEKPEDRFFWLPLGHRAPCGAHCCGGGHDPKETDVHIPTFGKCPRCGLSASEIAHTITREDEAERVVFHKYVLEYVRRIGYRIDLEAFRDGQWTVLSRWNTNYPDSLQRTLEWAERYVPWLKAHKERHAPGS